MFLPSGSFLISRGTEEGVPWLFSGLRTWCCRCGSSVAAVVWFQSLAWELPHAAGVTKKKKKKGKKMGERHRNNCNVIELKCMYKN